MGRCGLESGLGLLLFRLRGGIRSVQFVHGVFGALVEKHWQDLNRSADTLDDLVLLCRRRAPQDVIEDIVLAAGMPDTEPHAPELAAKMGNQVLEAIVSARAAAELEAHRADRQIELVMRNQHLCEVDLAVIEEALHRESATIHESKRLEDLDVLLADANLCELALEAALRTEMPVVLAHECVGEPKAGVVTRERVLRPGIAETDDESKRERSHG